MKSWVTKIWPLPPVKKRKLWPFFMVGKIIKQGCRVERDGDYLFYQVGSLIEKISFIAFSITLIDLYFETEILVNQNLLATNKTAIIAAWGKIMGPVVFILGWITYLRIRLPMDLANQQIPFFLDKSFMRQCNCREWTLTAAILVTLFLIIFPFTLPHFSIAEDNILNKTFGMHFNTVAAISFEALFALIAGGATACALSSAIEKCGR